MWLGTDIWLKRVETFFTSWNPNTSLGPQSCLLVTGPSGCGKSHVVKCAAQNQGWNLIPVHCDSIAEFTNIIFNMSKISCGHLTQEKSALFLDDLDSLITFERSFSSGLVKFLTKPGASRAVPIIFTCSQAAEKKLGELKRIIPTVSMPITPPGNIFLYLQNRAPDVSPDELTLIAMASHGSYTMAEEMLNLRISVPETKENESNESKSMDEQNAHMPLSYIANEKAYNSAADLFNGLDVKQSELYLSGDPWLGPLNIFEDIPHVTSNRDAYVGLLNNMLQWGQLASHEWWDENPLPTFYAATAICANMKSKRIDAEKGGHFTKLLSEHSLRKKNMHEKQDSLLPWSDDPYGCTGSKLSYNTLVSALYGRP